MTERFSKMTQRTRLIPFVVLALICALVAFLPAADQAPPKPADTAATRPAGAETQPGVVTVTIFATGDIHEHTQGLARAAGYVKAAKAKDPNVLFFDAGDTVHQYGEGPLRATDGEGMWRLMKAAGYDAFIFGNHDHGMGRTRIIELKRKLPDLPLLAANIDWSKENENLSKLIPPYKIFQLKGVKVAVIGASSDEVRYTRKNRFNVYYAPQAVVNLVPQLRKQADIVIAITHEYEEQDYALANSSNAPDLIVGGHSHGATATPYGREKKSFLLKAGRYARYLGMAQIKWDGKQIVERTGEVSRVVDDWPEDPEVKALRDSYFEAYRKAQAEKAAAEKATAEKAGGK